MSASDWLVAASGPAGGVALAGLIISYVRHACKRVDEKSQPIDNETRHLDHELIDVRSDVFKPNELVATLCVTCDKQFPPRLWEAKVSAELDALDGKNAEVLRPQHSLSELEKLGFWQSGQSKVPGSMNVLVHFRCKANADHTIQLILHDRAHAKRFREYKGFGGEWKGNLEHNSACHGHRSHDIADGYVDLRPSFSSLERALKAEGERLSEKIASMTGIPRERVLRMTAGEAQQAIEAATKRSIDAYGSRLWEGPDPEPTPSWTYSRFRQYGWRIVEMPTTISTFGMGSEHDLLHVTLAKGDKRFLLPMTKRHYAEWHAR